MNKSLILLLSLTVLILAHTPILPADYVSALGKGFDVNWSEFPKYMKLYNSNVPQYFKSEGFTNARIRMNDPAPDQVFMNRLKEQVQDCINNDVYPIIAYQARNIEESTDHVANKQHLIDWWGKMAETFKDYSYTLSFNILIEISGTYKTDYTRINDFYIQVLQEIRKHDAYRIVIFPPVKASDPAYLQHLEIPGGANELYTMAEWHYYAAGPSSDPTNKKYWLNGQTQQERDNILNPLEVAYDWSTTNNIPTWLGAWMPGNFNEGNQFLIPAQVSFASFLTKAMDEKNIPWSVNAEKKYYDYDLNKWFQFTNETGIPVIHAMQNPNEAVLYANSQYRGPFIRLAVGQYDESQLAQRGFLQAFSIMVPIDMKVTLYNESGFQGGSRVFTETDQYLHPDVIKSIKVESLPFSPSP